MQRNHQNGRSMVEMVLVIGIIGVLAVSAIMAASSIYDRWQLSKVNSELRDLQKRISGRYAVVGVYDELTDELKNVVPELMHKGDKFVHSFGGEVLIVPMCGEECDKYGITFKNLPKQACRDLLLINWQVKSGTDLFKIKHSSGDLSWNYDEGEEPGLPVGFDDVNVICRGEKNDITWIFL